MGHALRQCEKAGEFSTFALGILDNISDQFVDDIKAERHYLCPECGKDDPEHLGCHAEQLLAVHKVGHKVDSCPGVY